MKTTTRHTRRHAHVTRDSHADVTRDVTLSEKRREELNPLTPPPLVAFTQCVRCARAKSENTPHPAPTPTSPGRWQG